MKFMKEERLEGTQVRLLLMSARGANEKWTSIEAWGGFGGERSGQGGGGGQGARALSHRAVPLRTHGVELLRCCASDAVGHYGRM